MAPDGSWLASGGDDGDGADLGRGHRAERAVLKGHTGRWRRWRWRRMAAGWPPAAMTATVRIWDVATGRERAVLKGHAGRCEAVAVAPDGSWLASGGDDGTVRIWDVAAGQERAILTGHAGWVMAVAVAPDGSWLASGGADGTVRIWDVATGRERAVLAGHTGGRRRWRWRRMAAGWPPAARTGRCGSGTWPPGRNGPSWKATPAGGGGGGGAGWQLAGLRPAMTGRCGSGMWPPGGNGPSWNGHTGWVYAVAVAPDGSWLASGGRDGTVRIWDVATGRERAVLEGHTSVVRRWRWRRMAAGWPPPAGTGRCGSGTWPPGGNGPSWTGHTRPVAAVAVAPDGSWLASGGQDGTVRIWDVATGRERAILDGHTSVVTAVAVAPDGSWLASGGDDGTVRIWDVATGQTRTLMRVEGTRLSVRVARC